MGVMPCELLLRFFGFFHAKKYDPKLAERLAPLVGDV